MKFGEKKKSTRSLNLIIRQKSENVCSAIRFSTNQMQIKSIL